MWVRRTVCWNQGLFERQNIQTNFYLKIILKAQVTFICLASEILFFFFFTETPKARKIENLTRVSENHIVLF